MRRVLKLLLPIVLLVADTAPSAADSSPLQQWLAGDHHVHSEYSVFWNRDVDPPLPILGSDGTYPISKNTHMAKQFGLAWMVTTDHGGQHHAKLNLEEAYPRVQDSRRAVPDLVHFFGFELNTPGGDHASVVVPHTHDEADRVYLLESRFDRSGADPNDSGANTLERMLEALSTMQTMSPPPVVIANHPSRSASGRNDTGRTQPDDLRAWNDAAPEIAVGMAGSPGRQAATINSDGSTNYERARGKYPKQPTYGGFDRMTAELGGFWDSMLGEGRGWWITANSDSHLHWSEGGQDFWPGEYSKTYVHALRDYDSILEALRRGHVFVTTGDLISELYVTATSLAGDAAGIGDTIEVDAGERIAIDIRVRDPEGDNTRGDSPVVRRVDLIMGHSELSFSDINRNSNPTTRVIRRFTAEDWTPNGEFLTMTIMIDDVDQDFYVRVRGTSTDQLEPEPDPRGDDPWSDLWFYSNPVFVDVE